MISTCLYAERAEAFEYLKSLDPQDEPVKSLRRDIRNTIILIKKSENADALPELKFYKYRMDRDDNFWKILSKTSLNIDTLSTVNSLSSPDDLSRGKEIFLSNMRGVIYKVKKNDTIGSVSHRYNISKEYILKVNKITRDSIEREYIFIPSGEVSNLERSLFLGVAFASPLQTGVRTSGFGTRIDPLNRKFGFHTGVDIACPLGSKVFAARKGEVIFSGYDGGYGLLVIVRHEHGYSTYYGHLRKALKKPGDPVETGDLIALSGNSGRTTGPHLHFEVRKQSRPVNPGILLR